MRRGTAGAFLGALLLPAAAAAVDMMYSGSVALDHRLFVGVNSGAVGLPSSIGLGSLNLEVAHKVTVDVTRGVSANVKMCFGCHGIELDQAYGEFHVNDLFNLRFGRINVPVGEFNARHDPANFTTPSKPLPYAMGDMLHFQPNEFNLGVVPTPYSDNGVEIFGSLALGQTAQLDYTAYAVKGLAGFNDIDFRFSRSFVDNNNTPAVGTRLVVSAGPVSLGASFGAGFYDRQDKLRYFLLGGELYARWRSLVLRAELIARRTDLDPGAVGYLYAADRPYYLPVGYYTQLDWEATSWLTLIYRADGLRRSGMPLPDSRIVELYSGITRHTVSALLRFRNGFLVKGGYEYWSFSGVDFESQHALRLALLFSY